MSDPGQLSSDQVVVIGGGVIGAACAYYLRKRGRSVTILEKNAFASGCSHANCGLVTPSHVLPLAVPGAVAMALKALMGKSSPFYIKPRFDLGLWWWLLRFALRCNRRDMLAAGKARQALLDSSKLLYLTLIEDHGIHCEWEERGCLYVFHTDAAMEKFGKTNRFLSEEFGVLAKLHSGRSLSQLDLSLKDDLAGAWHYEMDGHLRPDQLMGGWRAVLESMGVVICEQVDVLGFDTQCDRASAVHTNRGDFSAGEIVLATGALAPRLGKQLGFKLHIQPGKGYSITTPRPQPCPTMPMVFHEHKVVATPMRSGLRLGSTMEFGGYDTQINRARLGLLESGARHYLNSPLSSRIQEEWYGWRPMSHDDIPKIGPSRRLSNVFVATGHGMVGLSMGAATGRLVAELVTGEQPHIDPSPYIPD